jgi:Domain of unknown function (DUF4303)
MDTKTRCRLCGVEILLATAERTRGACMPCLKGPDVGSNGILHQLIADNVPVPQLIAALDAALSQTTLRVARQAASSLQAEGIYGFWLYHHVFQYACATAFTETGLDAVARRYREGGSPDDGRGHLRWSPCDSPHHLFGEAQFRMVEILFAAVEAKGPQAVPEVEIHRAFLRALWRVRGAKIFDPSVVIALVDADHPAEEPYAYAEQFCAEATLRVFRGELGELREDYLERYRAEIPTY